MTLDVNLRTPEMNVDLFRSFPDLTVDINAISRSSGITPSGTLPIQSNGTHNVYEYQYANVNIPTGPAKGSSDLTVNGNTVTAPAGLYSANASKSVASGSQGTPIAEVGSVSNHQVSVTPKCTDTTGYISGTTKTGTPVTVKASDLVSGTLAITNNGENDVTNYQKVNVNVSSGGGKAVLFSNGVNKISNNTSYVTTSIFVTIQKAGTYKFTWFHYAYASSSSYYLTRLYKGTTAVGSTHASPAYSSGPQAVSETLTCAAGEVYTVYARTRSGSSYWTCVGGLVAEEQ